MRRGMVMLVSVMAVLSCEAKKPKVGAVCAIEQEGTFVCADAKTGLVCQASRRREIPCRGPKGCAGEKNASCDTSLAREGDACVEAGDTVGGTLRVCSENKSALLACRDGHRTLDLRCRGPKGCDPTKPHPENGPDDACDRSLGEVGDACNTRGWDGESLGACSVDKKALLKCDKDENGKLVVSRVCDGPKGCAVGHLGGDPLIPMPVCDGPTLDPPPPARAPAAKTPDAGNCKCPTGDLSCAMRCASPR